MKLKDYEEQDDFDIVKELQKYDVDLDFDIVKESQKNDFDTEEGKRLNIVVELQKDDFESKEDLCFNKNLKELIESLKIIQIFMEDEYLYIEDEIEGKEEKLDVYISTIVDGIKYTIKELPDIVDEKNIFRIGKIRHEEILNLLENFLNEIDCIGWKSIPILDKHIKKLEMYVTKKNKDIINERRRDARRNENGFTKREISKQTNINKIQNLKERGLTQSQVIKELGLSKGLVSRYWESVYLNEKWFTEKEIDYIDEDLLTEEERNFLSCHLVYQNGKCFIELENGDIYIIRRNNKIYR